MLLVAPCYAFGQHKEGPGQTRFGWAWTDKAGEDSRGAESKGLARQATTKHQTQQQQTERKMKKQTTETIDILDVKKGRAQFYILGDSPLICNAMSAKAQHELLLPRGRKTAADKASTLKHNPEQEFRDSVYYSRDDDSPTLIVVKATSFKKATMGAALDLPGTNKTQIGRLLYVVGDEVPIYGIPEIMLSVTRSADIKKTPDVRSRAIFPAWCTKITVEFAEPILKAPIITKLMAAAGITQGVGDWRVEKGSGNYGRFSVVSEDHPQIKMLMDSGTRQAQREALDHPAPYDSETDQLLSWYETEIERRGFAEKGGLKAVK